MPFKTALEAALAHLKSKGIIKYDNDIMEPLELKSKGMVSSYASGRAQMSNNFKEKFENYFKIRLSDFEPESHSEDNQSENFKTKYYRLLEQTLTDQRTILNEVRSSLVQLPIDMVALTAKLQEGQKKLLGKVDELVAKIEKSSHSKTPSQRERH